MNINRLLVAGVPGSGKSTLIDFLGEELTKQNIKYRLIDDFQYLKEICPPKATKEYYYKEGNLVIEDEYRAKILKKMHESLSKEWKKDMNELLILEITHPKISEIIGDYMQGVGDSALFFVECEMGVARRRNEKRSKKHRIPEAYMKKFDENYSENFKVIKKYFEVSVLVENNSRKNKLKSLSIDLVRLWFDDGFVEKTKGN